MTIPTRGVIPCGPKPSACPMICAPPCAVFAAKVAKMPFDALFAGIFVSALLCVIGYFKKQKNT